MTFKDILQNKPQELHDVALQLRDIILNIDKRIEEGIYGGEKVRMSLYSIGGDTKVLYGINLGTDHVKVFLHHTNAPNVDVVGLKLEGKGKHAKHVKLKSIDKEKEQQLTSAFKSILIGSGY